MHTALNKIQGLNLIKIIAGATILLSGPASFGMGGSIPQDPNPAPTTIPTSTPKPSPSPSKTPTSTPSPSPTLSPSPLPTVTPSPTPSPTQGSGIYSQKIQEIASTSSCAKYKWVDRSRAPAGYMKGMALTFARSICRRSDSAFLRAPATLMSRASTGNTAKDALAYYQDQLTPQGLPNNTASNDTLRALYLMGLGLGMRESSGKYCEGWDTTAKSQSASEAEAGLFQVSYNSMGATNTSTNPNKELENLYKEYKANPGRCLKSVFIEGATCKAGKSQDVYGTGAGAEYQQFNKDCPAFAAEYAMTLMRILRAHWGPINRKEVEIKSECNTMLSDVQRFVESDFDRVCADLR